MCKAEQHIHESCLRCIRALINALRYEDVTHHCKQSLASRCVFLFPDQMIYQLSGELIDC